MKDIIKGLWKWIVWIFVLLLVGAIILALRIFVIDKDYNGKASSSSDKISNSSHGKDSKGSSDSGTKSGKGYGTDSSNGSDNGSTDVTDTVNPNGSESLASKAGNTLSSLGQKAVNGAKAIGNATVRGYKEDEEVYTYNMYNFDEWFLMHEGEQYDGAVKNVLEHLIENSKEDFYARTTVTATNFGGNVSIAYNGDVTEYQNAIRNLENAVSSGMYDISFKYAGIMTYVNEIVITKK